MNERTLGPSFTTEAGTAEASADVASKHAAKIPCITMLLKMLTKGRIVSITESSRWSGEGLCREPATRSEGSSCGLRKYNQAVLIRYESLMESVVLRECVVNRRSGGRAGSSGKVMDGGEEEW